ncbi:MAG: GntR family transcriptional regulator [Ilumatobacteraceae bacterium]
MIISPVARQSVADAVYAQLRDAIIDDIQPAGSTLPSERELSEQASVNRQAIREALQRLREANLVTIVHGGGVRVRDWRRTADLALLPEVVVAADGRIRPEPSLAMLQLRTVLGVDAARLAAERITDDGVATLRERLAETVALHDGTGNPSSATMIGAYERIWVAIVDASRNIAYRLMNNSFHAANTQFARLLPADDTARRDHTEPYVVLVDAIAAHDPEAAAAAASEALGVAERVMTMLVSNPG